MIDVATSQHAKVQPGSDWYMSDWAAVLYAENVHWLMEVGIVHRVKAIAIALRNPRFAEFGEVRTALAAVDRWLPEAEAFEAIHGPGSKIDWQHPEFLALRKDH